MRIVQAVGWYFPDRVGGTEIYVAGLARRLRARGHDVWIAAPEPGATAPRCYTRDDIRVHRFPIPASLTRDQAQGREPIAGGDWFARWIREARPDVVHFHTLVPGLELPEVQAAKATAARVIATTHASSLGHLCARGSLMQWGETLCDGILGVGKCAACDLQKRGLPRPAARALAMVPPVVGELMRRVPGKAGTALGMTAAIEFNRARQQALLSSVDRFVLLTAAAAEIVARNGAPAEKIALNRLGIDRTTQPKPVRPTARPVRIGYVGRFDPLKGVYDLARAIEALPPTSPVTFEFRGPSSTESDRLVLDDLERRLGRHPLVSFGPALTPEHVPAHLASLDTLCCPSVCLEGGPTVAIEAHAAGTPVVGTRIGGLAELVSDGINGRLVPPGDWAALATVLGGIADDPAGTIDRWRTALPEPRTMDQVTDDYLELYAA